MRLRTPLTIAAALLAVGVGSSISSIAAEAAGGAWAIQPIYGPPLPNGGLSAVSCPAEESCLAVGTFVARNTRDRTLIEQQNGASWTVMDSADRAGADDRLAGISCWSTTTCFAVGSATTGSGTSTLAEQWDGASWHLVPTPNPTGSSESRLLAVSCRSAMDCMAVGSAAGLPLAERWDGTSWQLTTVPLPGSAATASFAGVSCPTGQGCVAVGSFGANYTLVERWNGTAWRVQDTPNDGPSFLTTVSCSSQSACMSVGYRDLGHSTTASFAEAWDGTGWSIVTTPDPGGTTSRTSALAAVSCASPTACIAVGGFRTGRSAALHPLADRWDGTEWTITSAADGPVGSDVGLAGVACSGTASCTAVGSQTGSASLTFAEIWNGSSWAVAATPNGTGASDGDLSAVSCLSASACVAVGVSGSGPLAEAWNGTAWRVLDAVDVPDAYAEFTGISCAAVNTCMAVGWSEDASSDQNPLAEEWDGTSWHLLPVPDPGSAFALLRDVSCVSATYCVAVGDAFGPLLAEVWDGATWTITPLSTDGGSYPTLQDVSCVSARYCVAVGDGYSGSDQPLSAIWDGASWTLVPPPNRPHASAGLYGVSCVSRTACTAAGSGYQGHQPMSLIETWNGTSWRIRQAPNPTVGRFGVSDVSCASRTACVWVGNADSGTSYQTVAEAWDGIAWTVVDLPQVNRAIYVDLRGVSCVTDGCTAVGVANVGTFVPLVESNFG